MGMKNIFRVDTCENLKRGVNKAGNILLAGGSVAFPTESFYGLGVNAMDEEAIRRLFHIKCRESGKPVLILLPSRDDLQKYVEEIPSIAMELTKTFWPGGLTIILNASSNISPLLTSGTGKIGVRLSSHPVAAALTGAIHGPITGTSANISGEPPCAAADEVQKRFGEKVDLILDGGRTGSGKGSTILDVTTEPPEILREGMISREQLKKFIA
ncbi:MAG: threonylcarbamoyl-AMP synthase [Deltaproteobacteria bacterium]|nr:threonylcarbamoyl-AMP synthase [Deltaproteobacteria bacterium]